MQPVEFIFVDSLGLGDGGECVDAGLVEGLFVGVPVDGGVDEVGLLGGAGVLGVCVGMLGRGRWL